MSDALVRTQSATYLTPTITDGRPTGGLDAVTTSESGSFRIEVGAVWSLTTGTAVPHVITVGTAGTDITTYRDVPTQITELSFGDPYGEITGSIVIPAATPFDDLSWLTMAPNIDIYRVLPADEAVTAGVEEVPFWHGFIASVQVSDFNGVSAPVTCHLMGALFGEASLRAHQPQMYDPADAPDIGTHLGQMLDPLSYSRPLASYRFAFTPDTTGITTRNRGSRGESVLDHVDELLALAQDVDNQWTIARTFVDGYPVARSYYLVVSNGDTQLDSTVTLGGYGIDVNLTHDYTQQPNAIYGEGTARDGSRWRNAKYPLLTQATPPYPDHYPIDGTTGNAEDADYTADVVTQLQYQLRAGGWPDVEITGIWDDETGFALYLLQLDAGVTATGTIEDNGDWDLAFSDEAATGTTDLSSGYFRPLSEVTESQPYTFRPDGAVTGDNGSYDGRIRVERVVAYGDRISKARATKNARKLATQSISPVWSGEVTLTADPQERSRLLVAERANLIITDTFGAGETLTVSVSGVTISPEAEGMPVSFTVSTQRYALLDLSTRLERQREADASPAKSFYALRNRPYRPFRDAVGWDKESGAGDVAPFDHAGGVWVVKKIVGAQRGQVAALKAKAAPATEFALALFGEEVDTAAVAAIVADPLADEPDGYGWWNHPDSVDALEALSFVEAWGDFDNPAGYWPGAKTNDPVSTLTGKVRDSLSWEFVSADPPFLWLAVWCVDAATFSATMRVIIEE